MNKKLGLLLIRGSGKSGYNRQMKFIERLERRLTNRGFDTGDLQFELVDWYEP